MAGHELWRNILNGSYRYFSFEKGGKKIGPVRGLWGGAHPGFLDESCSLRPGQHVGSVKSAVGGTNTHSKAASKSELAVKCFEK